MGFLGLFDDKKKKNKSRCRPVSSSSSPAIKNHDQLFPTEDTLMLPKERPPTMDERMQHVPDYLREQAYHLYELSKKGPLSFRVLAFLGGLAMIFASFYGLLDSIVPPFSASGILIAVYTFCFGCMICALEGRHFQLPREYQQLLKFYFRVLDYTWGRGMLYAFGGSLQLTQADWMNFIVGFYMIFVGVVALISSIGAGQKLAELRLAIDSKRNLRRLFDEYDKDKDHTLSTAEFAALCGDLGVDVTYQELVACFNAIDKNDDDLIQWIEFQTWWTQWGMKHLHRSMQDVMV